MKERELTANEIHPKAADEKELDQICRPSGLCADYKAGSRHAFSSTKDNLEVGSPWYEGIESLVGYIKHYREEESRWNLKYTNLVTEDNEEYLAELDRLVNLFNSLLDKKQDEDKDIAIRIPLLIEKLVNDGEISTSSVNM